MNTIDMTMALVVGGLFAAGFYLMLQRSLMRIVLGFILLGHGTNLLLLVAGGTPGRAPVLEGEGTDGGRIADPLPQAMALTAIVITFGLTAFLVALAYRSWRLSGDDEVRDDVEDGRIGTVRADDEEEPATRGAERGADGAATGGDR
ncbi:Na(+)/H(+) antiporter subunit C [Streptomyces sp. CRN 30]|uniref:Na(+)/H(+) antiporter subunit C n=1 Tax=Streptomyces sp. CRN 30 TaxID=3075613 RepID=UPI002A8279BD|nr:Na(+)/H(+) antiporter subunit C [Streptomyces sp. CRN 30]